MFSTGYAGGVMRKLYYSHMQSPAGRLKLAVSDRGLAVLEFAGTTLTPCKAELRAEWVDAPEQTASHRRQLEEYFAGQRRQFDFPLDLAGTPFQLRCWQELLRIPYGETISYAELARRVGSPNGFRAVGMANHQNPIAIVVPCHRVLASDGTLGGYGGGLPVKRMLLDLEQRVSGTSCRALDQQEMFA